MTVAHIRQANDADATACAAIYAPYVRETAISFETIPPSAAQMSQRISDALATHTWLVAERDALVVGYAYAHPFAPRAAYRWSCETSIYLDRNHCGGGVGRTLYTELLDRLAGRGYRAAFAGMTLPNAASAALHRALGYELVGVYRNVGWKNDAWRDVAWYQRAIGEASDPPAEPR